MPSQMACGSNCCCSVYCRTGVTEFFAQIWGYCWCFLWGPTVLQLQSSDPDRFWHVRLLLSICLTISPLRSLSPSLSPLLPCAKTVFFFFHFYTHTSYIKPFAVGLKEDSWAYFRPKVLISHNRLLCGSRVRSSYFSLNGSLLGGGKMWCNPNKQ